VADTVAPITDAGPALVTPIVEVALRLLLIARTAHALR
jgi:hypothetical protein